MDMIELIAWLIGIAFAMGGIGLGLFYQGRYLVAQENENKKLRRDSAEKMKKWGIIWLCISGIFLLFIIYLSVTQPYK